MFIVFVLSFVVVVVVSSFRSRCVVSWQREGGKKRKMEEEQEITGRTCKTEIEKRKRVQIWKNDHFSSVNLKKKNRKIEENFLG